MKANSKGQGQRGDGYSMVDMYRDACFHIVAMAAILGWIVAAILWLHMTGRDQALFGIRGTGLPCAPIVACDECWERCQGQVASFEVKLGTGPGPMDNDQ